MKKLISLSVFFFVFHSCTSGPAPGKDETTSVELTCEVISADTAAPRAAIYSRIVERKMKIGTLPLCGTISRTAYRRYGVPPRAESAVGGEVNGKMHFYYALRKEGGIVFYHGWTESDTLSREVVARFRGGRYELAMPAQ